MARRLRICIVDDDVYVGKALSRMLRASDYDVCVCANAEDFLSRWGETADSDCLLLDIRMPGMSGIALQEYLQGKGSAIPIVFMSSAADEALRALVMQRGAIDILRKPFAEEKLLHTLRAAVQG